MLDINNGSRHFRLTFIERIVDKQFRHFDVTKCWLEIKSQYINMQCECELFATDLTSLLEKLKTYYAQLSSGVSPTPFKFKPRVGIFEIEFYPVMDDKYTWFKFSTKLDLDDGWSVKGEIGLDQSYFPEMIRGIESIITN